MDKPYSPKEVAALLDVGDSTLRKWCLAIEEEGFLFSRTDKNRRVFFDRDIVLFKEFKNLVQVQFLSMKNASMIVVSKHEGNAFEQKNTKNAVLDNRSNNDKIEQMANDIEQLKDLNKQLLNKLDEQQKYIEERLNKRDSLLIESLREAKETKQLLYEKQEQEKKKYFWSKLFNK